MSEDPLDRLFEAPLDQFVQERNRLVRSLRKEGRGEQADELAALRKPTVPVWAVNQLARRQRRDVDLLLDAGHRLRAAQGEADPTKARDAFATARDAEREALKRLREGAEELLASARGGASRALVERVLSTLRTAAITEEGRQLLARGRLTEELEATGFELAAALVPKGKPPARRAGAASGAKLEAARADLDRARARNREASRRLRDAERDAKAAQSALVSARKDAEAAAAAFAAAQDAVKRARRRSS